MIFVQKSAGSLKSGVESEVVDIRKAESIRVDEYKEKSEVLYRVCAYFDGLSWERLAEGMTKEKATAVMNALINAIIDESAGASGFPKTALIKMDDLMAKA